MAVAERHRMSAQEFLKWELAQPTRHQFVAGEVFAMAGATRAHVTVGVNLTAGLHAALRGRKCRPFAMDMKVRVDANDAYFYPDVFVTCSAADLLASDVLREPTVIIEVLSESTAAYDRGDKFRAYRTLSSFVEYVLIDPEAQRIEVFRRDAGAEVWTLDDLRPGSPLELKSLGVSLPWSAVFEGVTPG